MLLASRLHSSNSDSNAVAHRHPRFARATLATGQGGAAVEVRVELSHVGAEGRLAPHARLAEGCATAWVLHHLNRTRTQNACVECGLALCC